VQSFSAIIGPNGSGKSNVIDAMLFVFGKRAKQVGDLTACGNTKRCKGDQMAFGVIAFLFYISMIDTVP
jgi:ABC-type Mn2+/Zn2+ transport system ATPase subunit